MVKLNYYNKTGHEYYQMQIQKACSVAAVGYTVVVVVVAVVQYTAVVAVMVVGYTVVVVVGFVDL